MLPIGGKAEPQLVRIQRLEPESGALVIPVETVFGVPQQGMSHMCQVGADLVGAAGEQLYLQ